MDGHATDILTRYAFPRYRLTLEDYHRMGEAGILSEDDRVELLEGQLVAMASIGPRHAIAVDTLMELLIPAVVGRAAVRVQNPVTLPNDSEPEPDIVLARRPWAGYPRTHPGPADVLLLVEAADSSREIDLGAKREIYASVGIREFWIVDLIEDCVIVCRDPSGGAYRSETRVAPSGMLDIEALPGVAIPAAPLFS
jgi:Uma2 family endonuclease